MEKITINKYRNVNNGCLRISDVGKTVKLAGWVDTIRKLGELTFVVLRDTYGKTQIVLNKEFIPIAKKIQTDITMLVNIHKKFHTMMETTLKNATGDKLPIFGEDFIKQLQFLKMASNYITKYPEYLEQMTTQLSKQKALIIF